MSSFQEDRDWAKTSILWAFLRGRLPIYLLGIIYIQAGGTLRLMWNWKKYRSAIKELVYCGCEFHYYEFPQTRKELINAVHRTLVLIAAEVQVFKKHRLMREQKARRYMSILFDSAKLLGLISADDYTPYYRESESILARVEADFLKEESERIM